MKKITLVAPPRTHLYQWHREHSFRVPRDTLFGCSGCDDKVMGISRAHHRARLTRSAPDAHAAPAPPLAPRPSRASFLTTQIYSTPVARARRRRVVVASSSSRMPSHPKMPTFLRDVRHFATPTRAHRSTISPPRRRAGARERPCRLRGARIRRVYARCARARDGSGGIACARWDSDVSRRFVSRD